MPLGRASTSISAALLLAALPLVTAHGDEHEHSGMAMDMKTAHINTTVAAAASAAVSNYFRFPEFAGWMYAHIALMTIAWAVVLPLAVMFSIARSRFTIPAQFAFLAVNAVGLFSSIIYDAKTPDLYPNNAHHKMGWAVTWIAVAWFLMTFVNLYMAISERVKQRHEMTTDNIAQYDRLQEHRWSGDSGHDSATLCSGSRSPSSDSVPLHKFETPEDGDGDLVSEEQGFIQKNPVDRFLSRRVPRISSVRALTAFRVVSTLIERCMPVLGSVSLISGGVVFGGIYRDRLIFSGMAHAVKGGIFFWYGILTLGRWMGAFSDFGWAWNVKPRHPMVSRFAAGLPSAEFVESFVIWLYGASNVFLEHLNAWGKPWSAQDLEHVSITIMFFGGGLMGMLIESEKVRTLFNTSVSTWQEEAAHYGDAAEKELQEWDVPKTYKTSLNPMPGLVIMLLGMSMSGHHQHSMVSTMMHQQWGTLFMGFALARAATYILLFLAPPVSFFPSRPPTELIASENVLII
ncbi:hypothetical protein AUEXF2481DRAFT_44233 [Aureobasidium subglaciale EXF-2481]|uniref:Integral membrane protein n=1 Tax=Aureobasidium subglaciale (strain EXF-2481) TaxID=1043005 RepID=A0A074Y0B5_AURSE|nr:uncharacterized protein AUEXF2481DRAFT_44233 [Aureobasidium subglaciale EXF-2481]KAI5198492.1 hypothetical protein E4T38_07489 [Aureobasidium subglaciale]KAI5217332.1 hypothetical protein E4T40_07500 [Aureobasidium subglaciale]KAI5220914.1 hypothetical protein E4T41_07341 [Aureobasidium subglaciale]KAI5258447.1 hypothetical protein E4T46_07318 [Aureobasidium subglaciale]KEQ91233.1 hypothetical protein AUEXF2481DRAFT_44233 [Aureobasidium subglaciale EXF-2481]